MWLSTAEIYNQKIVIFPSGQLLRLKYGENCYDAQLDSAADESQVGFKIRVTCSSGVS